VFSFRGGRAKKVRCDSSAVGQPVQPPSGLATAHPKASVRRRSSLRELHPRNVLRWLAGAACADRSRAGPCRNRGEQAQASVEGLHRRCARDREGRHRRRSLTAAGGNLGTRPSRRRVLRQAARVDACPHRHTGARPRCARRQDRDRDVSEAGLEARLVAAGLRHHRIYDLRNSFISWHLIRGTPISTVAAWAGTSAREIEDTYKRYIPTEDAYASAIDDLTRAAFQSFGH
jgi:hypothetical protein